jgi:hypothetical protein
LFIICWIFSKGRCHPPISSTLSIDSHSPETQDDHLHHSKD